MNPTLALLLSRAYDGDLAPAHRLDLYHSGLTAATIRGSHLRSVPPTMLRPLLGWDPAGVVSALLFPFPSVARGFLPHVRVKVFPALVDRQGHAVKYLGPRSAPPRVYFPRMALAAALDAERPLYVVEGVKKALAVAQAGLPAIGIEGIEGWHVKGSRALLDDFSAIPLAGRPIELLPDGDVATNAHVERGVARLAEALRRAGASPRLVVLPATPEELSR